MIWAESHITIFLPQYRYFDNVGGVTTGAFIKYLHTIYLNAAFKSRKTFTPYHDIMIFKIKADIYKISQYRYNIELLPRPKPTDFSVKYCTFQLVRTNMLREGREEQRSWMSEPGTGSLWEDRWG